MRVCVSALQFSTDPGKRFAGVGRVMWKHLEQAVLRDRGVQFEVFIRQECQIPASWESCAWVRWHRLPIGGVVSRLWWEHWAVKSAARRLRCDLIHSLFASVPFKSKLPVTTVIHDAFPRTHGDWFTPRNRKILDWMTATGLRHSTRVITVSEFSRRELAKAYGVPESKFDVCYNGPGNDVWRMSEVELAKVPLDGLPDLDEPFVFSVSTLEPRKNLLGLIQAFERTEGARLLIAGARGWMDSEIFAQIEASSAKHRIHFLGYISDEQLNLLLNKCTLFALVSFVEGFGVPVLEAMAAGAPVVTSNTSSLPEVVGESAIFCDPTSIDSIAEALNRGLNDRELRERLSAEGLERAKLFQWDAVGDRIVQCFKTAIEEKIGKK